MGATQGWFRLTADDGIFTCVTQEVRSEQGLCGGRRKVGIWTKAVACCCLPSVTETSDPKTKGILCPVGECSWVPRSAIELHIGCYGERPL